MKRRWLLAVWLLCSCESPRYYTPPVPTLEMARADHVDLVTLQRGRVLFARRCVQCHTAPAIWNYRAEDWPSIVNSMAHRASLTTAERDAIIAYISAVRRQ